MKRFLLLFCFFVSVALFGQAPEFEWAIQQGGTAGDYGSAITTDTFGNVYTTGSFWISSLSPDTADFDPGPNFYGLVSNGEADIFVSKLNPNGDLLWAVSFGSNENDFGNAITTDANGNVYITGSFRGVVDFDSGPGVYNLLSSSPYTNIFVLKLDTNGVFVWARQMGGETHDSGRSIAVDDAGNVYTTGGFSGTADFDPGVGVYNLTYNSDAPYKADVFISCLDSFGNFVWAKTIGGDSSDLGNSIAIDSFSNIYVTGNFSDTIDFDPGPNELIVVGDGSLFILKLNNNGDFIWGKNMNGTLPEEDGAHGQGITIGIEGSIYTTGFFLGTVDFDPGAASYELSAMEKDIFILKLTNNGDFVWAKSIGGDSYQDCGNDIVLDENDNVYITGVFEDTVDFDSGPGVYSLSAINEDAYILKLDSEGAFVWVASLPTDNEESFIGNRGESITLDKWGNIYTCGFFKDTTDFDPDSSVYNLISNNGSTDIFIQKMRQEPCLYNPVIVSTNNGFSICPGDSIFLTVEMPTNITGFSYAWNTGETTKSILVAPDTNTIYTLDLSFSPACFSTVSVEVIVFDSLSLYTTEDLTVCEQEEFFLEAGGGVFYVWSNGDTTNVVSTMGVKDEIYYVTAIDENGCSATDSILVFVNELSDTTEILSTTCDSLIAGVLGFIYLDQNGCDSVVVENVVFVSTPEMPVVPLGLVIQEEEPPFQISIAEVPNATSYEWTIPSGVQILSGAGTNIITVDWNNLTTGGLVCVTALNECGSSPESCMSVTVDIIDGVCKLNDRKYHVFPNPTNTVLNIVSNEKSQSEFTLLDVLGREVIQGSGFNGEVQINVSELPSGVYWLKIRREESFYIERVKIGG